MRALCGAIIVAGSMIGLGLTAIAIGTRYHGAPVSAGQGGEPALIHLYQIDRPLVYALCLTSLTAFVGLGIAFFGLAYHHYRRNKEIEHSDYEHTASGKRART